LESLKMAEEQLIPVYLFGPIGTGRANEPALQVIKTGIEANCGEVLTPHVASWQEAIEMRNNLDWVDLWAYDEQQMQKAKLALGEVSYPSTGVGMELVILSRIYQVPTIAYRSMDHNYPTACLDGNTNPNISIVNYSGLDDLARLVSLSMITSLKRWING
jgi:hypothetical protein